MTGTSSTVSPERTRAPQGEAHVPSPLGGAVRAALRQHTWALRITLALLVLVAGAWAGSGVWLEVTGASGGDDTAVVAVASFALLRIRHGGRA
ncbi:hypothetical protein [Streptomyces cremeus]|uniref:Uncharacterized protein n=1 Tax=Streptomyces cremeus TaxID=66881 RepID=A0ABV5P926_STRCM